MATPVREPHPDPDAILDLPGAIEAWEDDGTTHTEATEELDERLDRLTADLGKVAGAEAPGVEFVVRTEQLMLEYRDAYGKWVKEDPDSREGSDQLLGIRQAP